jgi:hypothetical protein
MKLFFWVLAVLAALLVLAIKFLPWWASLLLLFVGVLGVRWGVKYLFKWILIVPFKMKGKALAGAAVRIHAIKPAPMPLVKEDEDEDESQRYQQLKWYYLDVSIRPPERSDGFITWEPGELLLVPPDTKADDLESGFDSEACEIYSYQVFAHGQFAEDEDGKYEGAQRLQYHIGIQPTVRQLKFRYYFELFGLISIPSIAV